MFVGITWAAAFLLALRDGRRPARQPPFGPGDHVGLGIHVWREPSPPLPAWKRVLAVPLFVLVSPVYVVVLVVVLPVVAWAALGWCWARLRGGGTPMAPPPGVGVKRRHLVELGDLPWWPRAFRDATTDYLAAAVRLTDPYRVVAPRLAAALKRSGATEVLDLCSGGGGPWPALLPALRAEHVDPAVTLSDLYPNAAAFEQVAKETPGVSFEPGPVPADAVPPHLGGFRTLFAGFHHFRPADARAVLAAAVRDRRGIAVIEATARTPAAIALMFLTPLIVWLITPRVRPFRWSRLAWTYLIPVVPAAVLFDGVVSCLRTYTPAELLALAAEAGDGYDWEAGADYPPRSPVPVIYLIGVPRLT